MPLAAALPRARSMSAAAPSTPTTACARRASARVKLPSPQNRSSTRAAGGGASSCTARATSAAFTGPFTWMKSVGANASVRSKAARRYSSGVAYGSSGATDSSPPLCR